MWNVVWCDVSLYIKYGYCLLLDEECYDKKRYVFGSCEVGGYELGIVVKMEVFGFFVNLYLGEDI